MPNGMKTTASASTTTAVGRACERVVAPGSFLDGDACRVRREDAISAIATSKTTAIAVNSQNGFTGILIPSPLVSCEHDCDTGHRPVSPLGDSPPQADVRFGDYRLVRRRYLTIGVTTIAIAAPTLTTTRASMTATCGCV